MRGRAVWTLLSGASVLLATTWASAQCTKDTDCKGTRVCEAGKCMAPAPAAPPGSAAPTDGSTTAPPPSGAAPAPADGVTLPTGAVAPAAPSTAAPSAAPGVTLALEPTPSDAAPIGAVAPLAHDEPPIRRRSRGAMIGGIIMVSVGPIALLGALAAKNAQDDCDTSLERDYPDRRLPPSERYRVDQCSSYSVPLYVFGIGGALLSVAGIPLIIYGAKSVPNPPRAQLQVLPWAVPGSTGVKLRLDL